MKSLALAVVVCALAVTPVAVGAGASATSTPKRPQAGKVVEMLVKGMKASEKVKAHEQAPFGQTRNLYPRAGKGGSLLVRVKAEVKGKHTWTFTGRNSKRSASTSYYVK